MGKQWKQWGLYFGGAPKSLQMVTAAMKLGHLLLGRKVMTNLDSILKSRDIPLPTKVHLVKAMVFPVVMYGCESWTIKKGSTEELMLLNCGVGEDSWESWTARKSNQSILKEISPGYSLEGLMLRLKLQYFGHLMQRADSLEKTLMLGKIEDRRRRGQQRMRLVGWHYRFNGHGFGWTLEVGDGQGGLACCGSWDRKELDTTERLNWRIYSPTVKWRDSRFVDE